MFLKSVSRLPHPQKWQPRSLKMLSNKKEVFWQTFSLARNIQTTFFFFQLLLNRQQRFNKKDRTRRAWWALTWGRPEFPGWNVVVYSIKAGKRRKLSEERSTLRGHIQRCSDGSGWEQHPVPKFLNRTIVLAPNVVVFFFDQYANTLLGSCNGLRSYQPTSCGCQGSVFLEWTIGVQWYSRVPGIRFNYPVRTRIR